MNKPALVRKIIALLHDEVESYARAARAAHAEATDPQSKAENKYDTRGLEAAYLAGAQSRQAAETLAAIEAFEKLQVRNFQAGDEIDLSAVVEVENRGEPMTFFIAPSKGGLEVRVGKKEIMVITPQASLGQLMVGRKCGESFQWSAGTGAAQYRITAVA